MKKLIEIIRNWRTKSRKPMSKKPNNRNSKNGFLQIELFYEENDIGYC